MSKSKRSGMILAFQAVPATPMLLLPFAAAAPATRVPCPWPAPWLGSLSLLPEKSRPVTRFPAKSGWPRLMPSSMIAMITLGLPTRSNVPSALGSQASSMSMSASGMLASAGSVLA